MGESTAIWIRTARAPPLLARGVELAGRYPLLLCLFIRWFIHSFVRSFIFPLFCFPFAEPAKANLLRRCELRSRKHEAGASRAQRGAKKACEVLRKPLPVLPGDESFWRGSLVGREISRSNQSNQLLYISLINPLQLSPSCCEESDWHKASEEP